MRQTRVYAPLIRTVNYNVSANPLTTVSIFFKSMHLWCSDCLRCTCPGNCLRNVVSGNLPGSKASKSGQRGVLSSCRLVLYSVGFATTHIPL